MRPTVQIEGVTLSQELLVRACSFLMFYMKEHMFIQGKVEAQLFLIDLNFARPWSLPINAMRGYSSVMSLIFRAQAARVIVLNANKGIVMTYNGLSYTLQEI